MATPQEFILGEFPRTLDERFRISMPRELADPLLAGQTDCILAKERPGCLSLWNAADVASELDQGVELVRSKMRAGRLEGRLEEVQMLGRLLSTRHKTVQLAGRGRLSIPDGFREFLGVEQGGEVIVVGAGVCVEIWNPRLAGCILEAANARFPRSCSTDCRADCLNHLAPTDGPDQQRSSMPGRLKDLSLISCPCHPVGNASPRERASLARKPKHTNCRAWRCFLRDARRTHRPLSRDACWPAARRCRSTRRADEAGEQRMRRPSASI